MSADLRAVADPDAFDPPAWARRYVFDFSRPRPDLPCPSCGGSIALDVRAIGFAVKDGQRLCEECLCTEIPDELIDVTEYVAQVLATVSGLTELPAADRVAVQLCAVALLEWAAASVRKALP